MYDKEHIELLNENCYNGMADEYDSHCHITARKFDALTFRLFRKVFSNFDFGAVKNYLEVGVGTGVTFQFKINNERFIDILNQNNIRVDVVDISEKMLKVLKEKHCNCVSNYYISSIHSFYSDAKYNLIFANMCDPYLSVVFLKKAYDLLEDNGVFAFTYPHNEWAKTMSATNASEELIHFSDKHGNQYSSFSSCPKDEIVQSWLDQIGFKAYLPRSNLFYDKENVFSINSRGSIGFCTLFITKK